MFEMICSQNINFISSPSRLPHNLEISSLFSFEPSIVMVVPLLLLSRKENAASAPDTFCACSLVK